MQSQDTTPPTWAARFWSKVGRRGPDDCWLWKRSCRKGHGVFGIGQRVYYAHRIMWELANGPIPPGLEVRHQCEDRYPPGDTTCRRCCNPAHLALGTHHENMLDAVKAGRMAAGERNGMHTHPERYAALFAPESKVRGEAHPNATATEADVRELRRLYAEEGCTFVQLAALFGMSRQNARRIAKRLVWKHLP